MAPIWSKQPFKAIYTGFVILKLPFLLVVLAIRYGFKPFRPLPGWSFTAKAKERLSLVNPAELKIYSGVLAPGAIKPVPVGGVWFPAPISAAATEDLSREKVVLHFPGGAFVLAFAFEGVGQNVSNTMAQHMKATRTFVAQYRVATSSDTRFPAALQDLLTFYHYILSLGVDPKNIIGQ
ncbi:hypothetical protein DL769_006011 [Monosporascus sp. CRB-8-3]|nr:hypothetical protein DL769_006011 [Monosporascus sp. CRB-8-3]